jgi:hypothetical protein
LFLEPPLPTLSAPYQPRASTIHENPDLLKQLFITTYGSWTWNSTLNKYEWTDDIMGFY